MKKQMTGYKSLVFVWAILLVSVRPAASQAWNQLNPTGTLPSARNDLPGVYDPSTNTMMIYGAGANPMNEVWVLTSANGVGGIPTWQQLFPSGGQPQGRFAHAAVYDPNTNSMTIFGGSGTQAPLLNDVWALSNANGQGGAPSWTQLSPSGTPPSPRRFMSAVYNPTTNRMMLFGGCRCTGDPHEVFPNDVWVLTNANGADGTTPTWIQLSPTGTLPAGRPAYGLAYDPTSNSLMVFGGGSYFNNGTSDYYNDLWVLTNADGTGGTPAWINLIPNGASGSPPSRSGMGATYNSVSNRITIFGGATFTGGDLNDVWVVANANGLGGTPSWSHVSPAGTPPGPRESFSTVYDVSNNVMTIFGGEDYFNGGSAPFNDTWVLADADGSGPAVTLSPTSLTFGNQDVGTTSPPQTVTLSNTGTAPLTISSIGPPSGDFGGTHNCPISPATLAAGMSCTINVTFMPTMIGTRNGTLTIMDDASGSPQTVPLTGTGINPEASLSPTSLSFGSQVINTSSAARKVTLTSTGTTNLILSGITFSGANGGDFAQTNNCPGSMAPGAKCTINVTFTPSTLGAKSAALDVNDNAANSPQTVALSGTGVEPATLTPATASFGNVAENDPSAPKNFTLTNNQSVTLNISSITTSNPDFAQTNTCGSSLAAKTHCTITVTFTPSILGAETGTLSVTDDASNSPQTSSLSGTGIVPATLAPATANFGNVAEDSPSAPKNFTLGNKATVALAVSSITTSNPDFSQTNTCGSSLAAKSNCTITVTFTPSIIGAETGTLIVTDTASNSPQTASLSGTGIVQAAVSPTSLTFAAQKVGTSSAAKNVALTNNLSTALAINSITFTGADPGDFAQTNTCGGSLAAKSHCTISVTFKPTATGSRTATLNVNDSANNSPQMVSLTQLSQLRSILSEI